MKPSAQMKGSGPPVSQELTNARYDLREVSQVLKRLAHTTRGDQIKAHKRLADIANLLDNCQFDLHHLSARYMEVEPFRLDPSMFVQPPKDLIGPSDKEAFPQ